MQVTIGADPELFVKTDEGFISAHNMIPGTKAQPHPVKGGAVQVDGMALEFNIDPAETNDMFDRNIDSVLDEMRKMIPKEADMTFVPAVRFSEEVMANAPKEALALGCEPDFNAYTEKQNPPPEAHPNLRTAAGHVHIGWGDFKVHSSEHWNNCVQIVKLLDQTLGIWSLQVDHDQERRELYGRAGAFRPKPYGLEYRVLSNFWVLDKDLRSRVFWISQVVMKMFDNDFNMSEHIKNRFERDLSYVEQIINYGDVYESGNIWPYIDNCLVEVDGMYR